MSIKQEKISKKKKEKEYPLEVVGEIHYEDHPDIITHLIVEDIASGRRFASTLSEVQTMLHDDLLKLPVFQKANG